MFFICQQNAESMTKREHTLYGFALCPEKVSCTSPCRVSSSFSSTFSSSLSTTWPQINGPHITSTANISSPGSMTADNDNYLARKGKGNSLLVR